MRFKIYLCVNYYLPVKYRPERGVDIRYGYGYGLVFPISEIFEMELSLSSATINAVRDSRQYGAECGMFHLGLRVYPHNKNWSYFRGFGLSFDNYTET